MYKTRWTFFSLLYLNNELGRSWFLLGLWKQCAKSCLHVISEITKWAGYRHRIDPLRSSISGQNKSLNMTFHLKKKITEKEQILTENYFDRSKSRNGYISDSVYFLKSVLSKGVAVLWSFGALIPETLDFKGLRQFYCILSFEQVRLI